MFIGLPIPTRLYEMALKVSFYNQGPGVDIRIGAQLSSYDLQTPPDDNKRFYCMNYL